MLEISVARPILGVIVGAAMLLSGCTPPENEGGTPLPSALSEPPLYDEGVGPSDAEETLDEEGGAAP